MPLQGRYLIFTDQVPALKKLTRQNLEDILLGCAVLGTGGGGELDEGFELIDEALRQGKEFLLADPAAVPSEAMICTPYMLGAISETPAEEQAGYHRLPVSKQRPIMMAYSKLEAHVGRSFNGAVPCELGGSNTAMALYVAAMSGGYVVDADPAGRAVPEITHSTYYLNDLPTGPIVTANAFGETMVLENVADDLRAEELVRALATVSNNDIAAVDHALTMGELRPALIHGTLSKAQALGEAWRTARREGLDVPGMIAEKGQGFVAFRGRVRACDWQTEDGFTLGNIHIQGAQEYSGSEYSIWLKNENLIAWLDGEVHATIPDMVCLIDLESGMPVTNPNYRIGQAVAVVILPAPAEFVTERGLAAFGPRYLGYDFPYRPAPVPNRAAAPSSAGGAGERREGTRHTHARPV